MTRFRSQTLRILPREVRFAHAQSESQGDLGAHLIECADLKLRFPRFAIVTRTAFELHLAQPQLAKHLQALRDSRQREVIEISQAANNLSRALSKTPLPALVLKTIDEIMQGFSANDAFALRPSLISSNAQMPSDLFVSSAKLSERLGALYARFFDVDALLARRGEGKALDEASMAIVIQRAVNVSASGHCESLHAAQSENTLRIWSTLGFGGKRGDYDVYDLQRKEGEDDFAAVDVRSELVDKKSVRRLNKSQECEWQQSDDASRRAPSLKSVQAREVAKNALALEKAFGRPLRMGFAFSGQLLHILDVEKKRAPDKKAQGRERIFDRRLVPTALWGKTSPFSFSVAKRVCERAGVQTLLRLRIERATLSANRSALDALLGYVSGHIVGNRKAFRQVVDLLPFSDALLHAFDDCFDADVALKERSPHATWKAVADLEAIIDESSSSVGSSHKEVEVEAKGEEDNDAKADALESLLNHAISGLTDFASATYVFETCALLFESALARTDLVLPNTHWLRLFMQGLICDHALSQKSPETFRELAAASDDDRELLLDRYLAKHGRELNEGWRLESDALSESDARDLLSRTAVLKERAPFVDLRAKRAAAKRTRSNDIASLTNAFESLKMFKIQKEQKRAVHALSLLEKAAHAKVQAAHGLDTLAGQVHALVVTLGERFFADTLIDHPRDIFFLRLEEILGSVRGHDASSDLRALIAVRKRAKTTHPNAIALTLRTRGREVLDEQRAPLHQNALVLTGRCIVRGRCRGHVFGRGEVLGKDRMGVFVSETLTPQLLPMALLAEGVALSYIHPQSREAMILASHGVATVCIEDVHLVLKSGECVELESDKGRLMRIEHSAQVT